MTPREKKRLKAKQKNNLLKNKKNIKEQPNNYLLTVVYDGSSFGGYAKQKFSNTISQNLEEAISSYLNEDIKLIEASRTDAKVHALDQKIMFKSLIKIKKEKFIKTLNEILPKSINILNLEEKPLDFHARYDVLNKTYQYKIHTNNNIFQRNYSLFIKNNNINLIKINEICQLFVGTKDFQGFSSTKRDTKNTIRSIYYFNFQKIDQNNYFFEINANGFLYNMIRIIIGSIFEWLENDLSLLEIKEIINSLDRQKAGSTLSPVGLYLTEINYK